MLILRESVHVWIGYVGGYSESLYTGTLRKFLAGRIVVVWRSGKRGDGMGLCGGGSRSV
jgi:hypothetical protein